MNISSYLTIGQLACTINLVVIFKCIYECLLNFGVFSCNTNICETVFFNREECMFRTVLLLSLFSKYSLRNRGLKLNCMNKSMYSVPTFHASSPQNQLYTFLWFLILFYSLNHVSLILFGFFFTYRRWLLSLSALKMISYSCVLNSVFFICCQESMHLCFWSIRQSLRFICCVLMLISQQLNISIHLNIF